MTSAIEYNKKYYEEHKTKMVEQMKEAQKKMRLRKIIEKLNNNEYSRFPHSVIEKKGIKYDEEKKIYFI